MVSAHESGSREVIDTPHWSHPQTDIYELDASMLLNPFLDVIRSGNTTGPIAGAALSSVEKFLQYGIIGEQRRAFDERGICERH